MIWALTNYGSNEFLFSLKQDIILWIHKSRSSVHTVQSDGGTLVEKKAAQLYIYIYCVICYLFNMTLLKKKRVYIKRAS